MELPSNLLIEFRLYRPIKQKPKHEKGRALQKRGGWVQGQHPVQMQIESFVMMIVKTGMQMLMHQRMAEPLEMTCKLMETVGELWEMMLKPPQCFQRTRNHHQASAKDHFHLRPRNGRVLVHNRYTPPTTTFAVQLLLPNTHTPKHSYSNTLEAVQLFPLEFYVVILKLF